MKSEDLENILQKKVFEDSRHDFQALWFKLEEDNKGQLPPINNKGRKNTKPS
jgi:hypothetical protein